MNQSTTELWRKQETVSLSRFPPQTHAAIQKGLQVIRGEIPDDSNSLRGLNQDPLGHASMEMEEGEVREEVGTKFTECEMEVLRDILGPKLVSDEIPLKVLRQLLNDYEEGTFTDSGINTGYKPKKGGMGYSRREPWL
jgi:hypothetical protein